MKIGVNTLFLIPGQVGGSETYLREILKQWHRADLPHEFVVFTQNENHAALSERFAASNWTFIHCPFNAENRFARIIREQTELVRKANRAEIEALWSPGYTAPLLGTRFPQVVSMLDMQYKSFPEDLSWLARRTTDLLVNGGVRRCQKILAISEFSKREILQYTKAQPDQIHTTLLAADHAFRPAESPSTEAPYFLCVGNTYPHKFIDLAVRAFAKLEKEIPHRLRIIGRSRRGEDAYQAAVQQLSDPARVERVSGLSRREIVGAYQHATALLFPSQYEGFGLPVLEALSCGTPVVTTRSGSIPEVGGDLALYAEPDEDALAQTMRELLAKEQNLRVELRSRGPEWTETFSWTKTANQTLAVLQELGGA